MTLPKSAIVVIDAAWKDEVRQLAALPQYATIRDPELFQRGLLAERAVIEYLSTITDEDGDSWPVTWLVAEPPLPQVVGQRFSQRRHRGDLVWRGHELDVKLVSRHATHLHVKVGAQQLPHVFVEHARYGTAIRVLGVLPSPQPETFSEAQPLVSPSNGRPLMRSNLNRPVYGWTIARDRLQPVSALFKEVPA